jgi:peptidoglycan hydrolase-like protein with peptidoglycan-binding domain
LVRGSVDEKVNGPEFFKGQVSYLQLFLQQYFDITDASFVDGVYGPNTEYYVVQFQKQNGIDATGTVGPITRARITRFCADPSPAATHTYTLGEQFPQSFTIYPGESYAMNDVAHGGYRIEYVSKNNQTIRVTNRTDGGLATEHLKLSEGAVLMAKHTWPTGLQITVNKFLSDGGVSLTLESVSTD